MGASIDEFLDRLSVEVEFRPAIDRPELSEVARIIERTSVFNATALRPSAEQLEQVVRGGGEAWRVFVRDRFHDHGLSGAVLVVPREDRLEVDSLALSCPVLGRRVEYRVLRFLSERARQRTARAVRLTFARSLHNASAGDFIRGLNGAPPVENASGFWLELDPDALAGAGPRTAPPRDKPTPTPPAPGLIRARWLSQPAAARAALFQRLACDLVDGSSVHADIPASRGARERSAGFVPPRTPTEIALAAIWADLLRIDPVGTDHDFFELGGHSLVAVQMASRAKDAFAVDLSVNDVFAHPTVSTLAALIDRTADARRSPPPAPASSEGEAGPLHAFLGLPEPRLEPRPWAGERRPLAFREERGFLYWENGRKDGGGLGRVVSQSFVLNGPLDASRLGQGLSAVLLRHEILRSRYGRDGATVTKRILNPPEDALGIRDVSEVPEGEQLARVQEELNAELERPCDITAEPVLRVLLYRLGAARHVLLVAADHVIFDAGAFDIFWSDLKANYAALEQGGQPPPPPRLQYADFAAWQRERFTPEVARRVQTWWGRRLQGAVAASRALPVDLPRTAVDEARRTNDLTAVEHGAVGWKAPREISARLQQLASDTRVSMSGVLFALFEAALAQWAGRRDLVVAVNIDVRNRIAGLDRSIGDMTNQALVKIDLSGHPTFSDQFLRAQNELREALALADVPTVPVLFSRVDPLLHVNFNFVGKRSPATFPGCVLEPLLLARPERAASRRSTMVLDLQLQVGIDDQDSVRGVIHYNAQLWRPHSIEGFAARYQRLLERAVSSPRERVL